METKLEQYIILRSEEFRFLASMAGIKRFFALQLLEEELEEEQNAYLILHRMVEKGFFSYTGENQTTFSLLEPYRGIVRNLQKVEKVIDIRRPGGRHLCVYLADRVVTMEESERDHGAVRVALYEKPEWKEILSAKEFLPVQPLGEDIAALQSKEEMLALLEQKHADFEYPESMGYEFSCYELAEKQVAKTEKISVFPMPVNYWLEKKQGDDKTYELYTEKRLWELLLENSL
ncbi:MAG: hypothetical protein Q4B72_05925 [Lachnospiraceae bacterium]|nr:hypothetical protein [Lachnospiraceae bacterium]